MSNIPFFLCFATFFFISSSADQRLHSRHLLHQPFFPITTSATPPHSSEPPSPSPHSHHYHKNHPETPPPQEKHPFSSLSNPPPPPPPSPPHPNTFFPSSDPSSPTSHPPPSSPPPHRPASLPTFPANISSLLFPTNHKPHNPHHITKLVAVTISLAFSAVLLSLFVVLTIFLRRARRRRRSSPADDTKSTRDSLHLFNAAPSDGSLKHKQQQPPKYTSSNTSSEFLYLGTLVNSRSGGLDHQKSPISGGVTGVLELPPAPAQASSSSSSSSSYSQYQKLGSPELRPLPPLPKLPVYSPHYRSTELLNPKRQDFDGDDNENDEFFSPKGSPSRKQSPPRVTRSTNGSNSGSVSSSNGSPATSLKPKSLSPRLSLNSQNSSNGSVSKRPVPTRPPPPPPPPPPQIHEIPSASSLSPPSETSDSGKKEETLKPKLKALHWDKVRASSSRVTVWDQIKSNSFQ